MFAWTIFLVDSKENKFTLAVGPALSQLIMKLLLRGKAAEKISRKIALVWLVARKADKENKLNLIDLWKAARQLQQQLQ